MDIQSENQAPLSLRVAEAKHTNISIIFINFLYVVTCGILAISNILFSDFFGIWKDSFFSFSAGDSMTVIYYSMKSVFFIFLFIVAVVTAIGLHKRGYWARILGITIGVSLVLVSTIIPFFDSSYPNPINLNTIFTYLHFQPFLVPSIIAVLYLAIPNKNFVWENKNSDSTIRAIFLSGVIVVFSAFVIHYYYIEYHPYILETKKIKVEAEQQRLEIKQQKKNEAFILDVKAGAVYSNTEFGYKLTLPNDYSIYRAKSGQDETTRRFFLLGRYDYDGHPAFEVKIMPLYDFNSTEEKILETNQNYHKYWKRVYVSSVNGIRYVYSSPYSNDNAESFQYEIIHNNNIFTFSSYGGLTVEQFQPILNSLEFTQ